MSLAVSSLPANSAPPSAAGEMVFAWIDTEAGFRALAREWDRLLATMARPSPFLSWDWALTWWLQFGHAAGLRVITARASDGELLGLAPLHVVARSAWGFVPVRSLELLGYRGSAVCADHLDFLCQADRVERVVAGLLAEALRRSRDWDVLVLADLAENSALQAAWPALQSDVRTALRTAMVAAETCYFLPLPADVATLWTEVKRHHAKLASNVKYYGKRLRQGHAVAFRPELAPAELDETLAALARLHALARGRKNEAGNFGRESYFRFHQALLQRMAVAGKLYLARLECDGDIIAVLYGFCEGGVLYYYQSGFDTAWSSFGIGTLMLAWVLEDAITRLGVREFDFLRGAEEYKTRWASQARHTVTAYGWQRGWAGRLSGWEWNARRRLAPARAACAGWAAKWTAKPWARAWKRWNLFRQQPFSA